MAFDAEKAKADLKETKEEKKKAKGKKASSATGDASSKGKTTSESSE
jgi:hypothetical protein